MNLNEILVENKQKIDEKTELEFWYGKDITGKDVVIHENDLVDVIDNFFKQPELVDHCKENTWVVLPDQTRLVCSLSAAKEKEWIDIYDQLKRFY